MLQTLNLNDWHESISESVQHQALNALESGAVIYLPSLPFNLLSNEQIFLSSDYASPKTKNISFDSVTGVLQGAICTPPESIQLNQMMTRYASYAKLFLNNLFPQYQKFLVPGRTSFRPVEIYGRKPTSYRKDDTRLHVDAFPSTPTRGKRILRVFTNINPENKQRLWRLGAPFPKVVEYFYPKLKKPFIGTAAILKAIKITKEKRTEYDHCMLILHNAMKADLKYQVQVPQTEFAFPPSSSWIVFTDQVSHAAMSGQHVFEQTFYLPPQPLQDECKSPLKVLEHFLQRALI